MLKIKTATIDSLVLGTTSGEEPRDRGILPHRAGHRRLCLPGGGLLWVVILLGVALRIGSALYQGNSVIAMPGVFDQVSYHNLAMRVLEGNGFSFNTGWWPATPANQPTAHWSYLYVLFLAGIYSVVGRMPLVARLTQAILTGILIPLFNWRIGRRLFGPRVGMASAVLSAFYVYFVYYAGALVTESLYIVATLWVLDISMSLAEAPNANASVGAWKPWVLLGIALGVASLLRQVMLLLVPVILAWIGWQVYYQNLTKSSIITDGGNLQNIGWIRSLKMSLFPVLKSLTLTVLVFLAFILPWTIRNYRVFGQFVLLNTNAGFAFFWGNHPIHGTEFIPLLPDYGSLIPKELLGLNEGQLDKVLLKQGLAFVWDDPARYFYLSMSRAKEYFKFWPSQASSGFSNFARVSSFGFCFPFFLSGIGLAIVRAYHQRRNQQRRHLFPESLLLLVSMVYSLIHLMTWTLVRYRLPVDAVLMPFAALSIIHAYDWVFGTFRIRAVPVPGPVD